MVVKKKKKEKKVVHHSQAHIKSTFNNTIVTFTDLDGNVLSWASTGMMGFKNSKKGTPFAAQLAAEKVAKYVIEVFGVQEADIFINGPGSGSETAVRSIQSCGINILSIQDKTAMPHNGCRPPKKRRV